jgi:hypothetical protein
MYQEDLKSAFCAILEFLMNRDIDITFSAVRHHEVRHPRAAFRRRLELVPDKIGLG